MIDKVQISNCNYELFSGGLIGQRRGIVRWKDGAMQPPDWGKLETWIKDSIYTAGMNAFGLLTYAPWESKGHGDLLCPFAWDAVQGAWSITKIDPAWLAVFTEAVDRIMALTEPVKDNFMLQVMLFCEPWFHHGSPNPWADNIEGYHDFYDVPIAKLKPYIDAVLGVLAKYPGRTQVIIGCEMTTRPGSKLVNYQPAGLKYPVPPVKPEAVWMHKVALYLLNTWKLDSRNMGWGAALGTVEKNDQGEWIVVDDHTSLMLEVERIAGRMADRKTWNGLHTEIHGACGYWTPGQMAQFALVAAQFHGTSNARTTHFNTDGDNARLIGPEYASVHDRQQKYWRYNGMATRSTFAHVIRACGGKRADGNRLWCTVLPQTWDTAKKYYMENCEALAAAYHDAMGVWPYNRGKKPPVEPVPDEPDAPADPILPYHNKAFKWIVIAGIVILAVIILAAIL